MSESTGSSVIVHRLVAWNETDAAGHNHFAAAFRWLEEAEHALLRAVGMPAEEIARIPRVHIDNDYKDRLYYGQEIAVQVTVVKVGTSSCTYEFEVRTDAGTVAVSGTLIVVHASSTSEGSAPWPPAIRDAMLSGRLIEIRTQATES
ncbi:MAG: acyl-CoA thioesterase [Candidatus Nanopelagicales bacterium]